MISLEDVRFSYRGHPVLDGVTVAIDTGEHVAMIGPNASGKSTLARIMDALLLPDTGNCIVDGVDTRDDATYARRAVGIVFQDPERQLVARHVWDDVAFGPGNLGLSRGEIERRVAGSLEAVGMGDLRGREVTGLSGGQKQLVAIAGVLAMGPSYMILDEPTALLDGPGAGLVRNAIAGLKNKGLGIVVITHDMEEASRADRVIALCRGRILADTTPGEFFSDVAMMADAGVEPPYSLAAKKAAGPLFAGEAGRICR